MTDPAVAPLGPRPATDAEPWQARLEALAVLLVLTAVVVIISAFATARAQLGQFETFGPGASPVRSGFSEVVRIAGSSVNLLVAGALLVALLLVTLGPGDRVSRRGTAVLRSLVVVGLVAAGLAAVSAALTVVGSDDGDAGVIRTGWPVGDDLVTQLASVAPLVVTAVIAGYVAWCAFATLGEVPEVADGEGSTGDLATAIEGRWEIPPSPPTIDPDGGSWARPPASPGPGG